MFKQECKEDETSLQEALDSIKVWQAEVMVLIIFLCLQVLSKTLYMTKLTLEKIELATLNKEKGMTQIQILPADQMDQLIKKYEKVEAELEANKKEKENAQAQKPSKCNNC